MVILCTIDLETREVSLPAGQVIASYDHNVDVIRFQAEAIPGFSLNTSSIKIAAQGPNKVRHDYLVDPSTVAIEEETGYITFDWPIPAGVTEMPIGTFKYGDKGQLIFAVCAEIVDGSTVSKAWHSDDGIITVVAHLEPESGGGEDPSEEATNAQKIGQLQSDMAVVQREVSAVAGGTPTVVDSKSAMTEHDKIYILSTDGKWYYYSATAEDWLVGGTYGGAVTDTTLSVSGAPADSKAVGDALALKADNTDVDALDTRVTAVEEYADIFTADVDESVQNWLEEHPEATTTVEDRSLTTNKLVVGTLGYVTPEDYGAKGDGVTDDSTAINSAIASGKPVSFDGSKTYAISYMIEIANDCVIFGNGAKILEHDFVKPNGYNLVEGTDCNVTIQDLTIKGDWENTQDKQTTAITLYSCVSHVENLTVENTTSHSIVISGGKAVFSGITMHNVGYAGGNYSFVYATEKAETLWTDVYFSNDEYDDVAQAFYLASGSHTINNVQAYRVHALLDVRNGRAVLTNGYCYHTCGILGQTSGDSNGADITMSNVIFDDVIPFANTKTIVNINTCKNYTIRDCVMNVSNAIQSGDLAYLLRFDCGANANGFINRVMIDNLVVVGDSIVSNGIYTRNTTASDIIMKNCQFPVLSNGSAYAAVVYGNDLARFIFENCTFKNKTSNLYVYDNVAHAPYENVVVRSRYKQRGTTAERPVLWKYYESNIYYDTTLSKLILWNGTAWTNLDGTSL